MIRSSLTKTSTKSTDCSSEDMVKAINFCRNEYGMVLITGLAFMAILGIMGATAMSITSTEVRISHNYKTSKQALYIAEAGVERAIKDLEANAAAFDDILLGVDGIEDSSDSSDDGILVAIGSSVPLGDGTYDVRVRDNKDGDGDFFTDSDNKVVIASTGTIHGAVKKVEVVFSKTSVPVDVDGALSIYGNSPEAEFNGNPTVDGKDYDVPEDFNCTGSGCDGSVSVGEATAGIYSTDLLSLVATGSPTVEGNPAQLVEGEEEGEGHYSSLYWQNMATGLIPTAGLTLGGEDITNDQTLGTRDNPQITHINGDMRFTGSVDGAGILIVTAKVGFAGSFHYEGLVIILNNHGDDAEVEFDLGGTGTTRVFGAVVAAGPDESEVEMGGNARILYSSQALANVQDSFNSAKAISWRLR